jgi:HEAT repeat protein
MHTDKYRYFYFLSAFICVHAIAGWLIFLVSNSFAQNLESLADEVRSGNVEVKRSALLEIRNLRSAEASRLAVPALKDSSEIVRATAAFSVIYLPPQEAASVLLPLLDDKSAFVRREAAYALGKVRDISSINRLLQILQKDKILEVRAAAAVALGEIGDASAIDALTQILQKKSKPEEEFLRRSAARSIGQIAENSTEKFPVAATVLIQTLQNPKEFQDVKREAVFALGKLGEKAAIPVLQANLSSEDYYLAQICREALAKLIPNR